MFSSLSTLFSDDRIAYVYYVEGESFIKNNKVHLQSKEHNLSPLKKSDEIQARSPSKKN